MDQTQQTYINTTVAKVYQGVDSAYKTGISESYTNLYTEPEESQLYDQISEDTHETIFDVEVCDTDGSKQCRFHGRYKLTLRDTSLCLLGTSGSATYSWPLKTIRRFGVEHGKVFFMEAGRQAPSGEGLFKFKANRPRDIYDYVMARCKVVLNKTSPLC